MLGLRSAGNSEIHSALSAVFMRDDKPGGFPRCSFSEAAPNLFIGKLCE